MESNILRITKASSSSISSLPGTNKTKSLKYISNLHKFVIFLVITVLTGHLKNVQAQNLPRVDTEPSQVVVLEGEQTSVLCRSGVPIHYCRIKIPGEEVLNLRPEWQIPGYSYYGDGLNKGQCGVTIQKVSSRNHGQIECNLGITSYEATGRINLTVALTPNRPEIDVISPRGGVYEVDQTLIARCTVRNGRPAANISWYLDNEPINEGLGRQEEVITNGNRNTTLITTVQEIQRTLTSRDNGRTLICRATHIADHERPNESRLQLSVKYRPQPLPDVKVYGLMLGLTAFINVTIEANPRPRVEWTVDGVVIPQGAQNGRYEAYESIDLGNGFYNVTLSVAGLTLEDTNKDYYLKALNELGMQQYLVRISSSNTPASSGLDAGAIIGIVVALLIIVIAVLLILFARATGRWCFVGKSSKTTTSETLDDVQIGVNSALLRNPDNSNVVINKNNSNNFKDTKKNTKRKPKNSDNTSSKNHSDHHNMLSSRQDTVYSPTTIPIINNQSRQKQANNYSSIQHSDLMHSNPDNTLFSSSDNNKNNRNHLKASNKNVADASADAVYRVDNKDDDVDVYEDNNDDGGNQTKNTSNSDRNELKKSKMYNSNKNENIENSMRRNRNIYTGSETDIYNTNNNENENAINKMNRSDVSNASSSSNRDVRDLLKHGNEIGIPESRCSKWIPKDQREILEKQAKLLLVNRGNSKSTEIH